MDFVQGKYNGVRSTRGTRRHLTPVELQRIHDLKAAGESHASIARTLGISHGTVAYHCNPETKARVNRNSRDNGRRINLRLYHGASLDQYDAMLTAQGGGCAICGGGNPAGRALFVDHDHDCCSSRPACGRCKRGLLCVRCNTRLMHGIALGETFMSRREFNYVYLWRKRIARERPNPWDEFND
jgi:DNA-binding CsgD family transcriptional regulator